MSCYTIDQFSKITGLTKLLIRTWENRYEIFTPVRSETNIRKYEQDDLIKALNIQILREAGIKISKIAKLSNDTIKQNALAIVSKDDNVQTTVFVNKLIESALTFDEAMFSKTFQALRDSMEFEDIYLNVILPTMERIGYLWLSNYLMPAQEHFFTCLVKKQMFTEIVEPKEPKSTWLLFLMEDEYHDLSLSLANIILRKNNHKVIYLGQSVPLDSLKIIPEYTDIDAVLFCSVSRTSEHKMTEYTEELQRLFPERHIYCVARPNVEMPINQWTEIVSDLDRFKEILQEI